MRRFDGAVNWPKIHMQTLAFEVQSQYNLFNRTASYLYVAVSKKRAAVLKLCNRSH